MSDLHLSSRNRRILDKIFQHPMPMNLHWHDVIHLLEGLGAEVENASKDKLRVKLNGVDHFFRGPHHSKAITSKHEFVDLRHFMEAAGIKH